MNKTQLIHISASLADRLKCLYFLVGGRELFIIVYWQCITWN